MSIAPWDIFAGQLGDLGYGHPLWVPDPAPGAAQVEIGDVGYIKDGEFLPLFNAFRKADKAQPLPSVPMDHVPLDRRDFHIRGPRVTITQKALYSRSIKSLKISAGVTAGSAASPSFATFMTFIALS